MEKAEIVRLVREEAEKCLPEELELLKKLTSVDCATGNLEGNRKVVEIVEDALRTIDGIEIEHYDLPNYGIDLIGRLKPEHPQGKMILNAHTDTVFHSASVADHPFRVEGDVAYGLGIGDCKGGIAISINAVRIAQKLGILPPWEIVFMFNCDEEGGEESGYRFFDKELPADLGFVFESSGAEREITVARKSICQFKMDVTGIRSHSGNNYTAGRSAAVELAHRILRVYESNDAEHEIYFNVGELKNFDKVNVLSGHCTAQISCRVGSWENLQRAKDILARVAAEEPYLDGTETTITCTSNITFLYDRQERNMKLYEQMRDVGRQFGWEIKDRLSGGYGDVAYLANHGCGAAIDGLGAYTEFDHSTDEMMHVPTLTERTALFAAYLGEMK